MVLSAPKIGLWQVLIVCGLFALPSIEQVVAEDSSVVNDLNYLGTSGLFFVPSGTTLDYGELHFSYANMVDHNSYRQWQVQAGESPFAGNAFSLSLSPFPGLEIGMSNMGYDLDVGSDLIANLKYSPTFIPDQWFDLAVGAVDLGGETGAQRALYGSISKQIGQFRLTAGSGSQRQDQTLRRYEGGFAGVEYQPYPWLTAVAEHDGVNNHYGIKLRTPEGWMGGHTQIYGSTLLSTDIEDNKDTAYFGMGIRTLLFSSVDFMLDKPSPLEASINNRLPWLFDKPAEDYKTIIKRLPTQIEPEDDQLVERLGRLKRALVKQGFETVWVGRDQRRLVIRFENPVFNRNDIDALGVVMGLAASMAPQGTEVLDLSLSKYEVPSLRLEIPLQRLKEFYNGEALLPVMKVLPVTSYQADKMLWVGGSGSPFYVPRISFSPKIRHFAGTELGVLDYSIALRSTIELPLWSGAVFYGDYDHQLKETRDFESGRSFYRWSLPSRWSNFALKQTAQLPFNVYSSLGIGRFKGIYQEDYSGIFAEAIWQSSQGAHQLSFSGGYYKSNVFEGVRRELGVGRYRYYWDALDLSISVEGGQYWKQDRGGKIEFGFNFGDTQARFFVQDTDHTLVGIGFSVPIGLRKDMSPTFLQLKGTDSFEFSTSTMVNSESGCNCLVPGRAMLAPYGDGLSDNFFNHDRLSVNYIRTNSERLRDAYFKWVAQ